MPRIGIFSWDGNFIPGIEIFIGIFGYVNVYRWITNIRTLDYHTQSEHNENPFFLYFSPNAVHFPVHGKKHLRDPILKSGFKNFELS